MRKATTADNRLNHTAQEHGAGEHQEHTSLRLWLRLLRCTTWLENLVRGQLRVEFGTTLPRFDLMAQLARNPDGLKMGELSHLMMVSGGNITGITDTLEREGLVERVMLPSDRRAWKVCLTAQGREAFAVMATAHEGWIVDWLSNLTFQEQQQLHYLLGKLRHGAGSTGERDIERQ